MFEWAEQQAGRPKDAVPRNKDLFYFANDLTLAKGEDKLKWYILRDKGTPRFVASCCMTTFGMLHDAYQGNAVMVYADGGAQLTKVLGPMEQQMRLFEYDLTPGEKEKYPTSLPVIKKGWWAFPAIMPFVNALGIKVRPRVGSSIQDLLAKHGPPENIKLPKRQQPHKHNGNCSSAKVTPA